MREENECRAALINDDHLAGFAATHLGTEQLNTVFTGYFTCSGGIIVLVAILRLRLLLIVVLVVVDVVATPPRSAPIPLACYNVSN